MKRPLLFLTLLLLAAPAYAQEPALPVGLGGASSEPSLPSGLDKASDEPALPSGLGEPATPTDSTTEKKSLKSFLPFNLTGFWDTRAGSRINSGSNEKRLSLAETRLQLQAEKSTDFADFRLTADFLYDHIQDRHGIDLERGTGPVDLREAYMLTRPADFMDLKIGRQILTWGTGDLLFINDPFPKDWQSFLTGRDNEYIKVPSDALKVAFYSDLANLDIVYTPRFDSDRYISGQRLSYYNGNTGTITGREAVVVDDPRASWFSEDEWALRLHRLIGAYETALYAYDGYWKSPGGQTAAGIATFPRLRIYGASVRGPVGPGIGNIEGGWYDSRDDSNGTNPLINNGEIRFLAGYEQELIPNLTGSVQYYLEHMRDYDAYKANLPAGAFQKDLNRQLITVRLTKLAMEQNLELSLFNFWSPSDDDGYLRPKIKYKVNDNWSVEAGANFFYGDDRRTFFSQFEDNSNVYAGMRYSF